jgi:hypothetical protein
VDLEPCKLPTLGHLPCTSHAENSRFYVIKEKEKNYAKHKNPKMKSSSGFWDGVCECGGKIAFGAQAGKMTMRLRCLLRLFI